jgi:hypothetical protein
MGFMSFLKKIFSGADADDPELKAARARHGINPDEKDSKEADAKKPVSYDPWEDIRNMRTSFWFGSWAARKIKPGIVGEEKVKKQLAELEKKREEERKQKGE